MTQGQGWILIFVATFVGIVLLIQVRQILDALEAIEGMLP